jgi:hypothetical protein
MGRADVVLGVGAEGTGEGVGSWSPGFARFAGFAGFVAGPSAGRWAPCVSGNDGWLTTTTTESPSAMAAKATIAASRFVIAALQARCRPVLSSGSGLSAAWRGRK